jgi:hypothetical protein
LFQLDVRENNINAKGKSALKKAAGVGVFRSRCVQLKFLLFLKAAFNNTRSFSLLRMQDQASTLVRHLHRPCIAHEIRSCQHTGVQCTRC